MPPLSQDVCALDELLTVRLSSVTSQPEQTNRNGPPHAFNQRPARPSRRRGHAGFLTAEGRSSVTFPTLRQDLRHGVRLWSRSPGLSLAILTTLTVSVGAATAVFTFFDVLLLRPLPMPAPHASAGHRMPCIDVHRRGAGMVGRNRHGQVGALVPARQCSDGAVLSRHPSLSVHSWHRDAGRPGLRVGPVTDRRPARFEPGAQKGHRRPSPPFPAS